MTARPGFRSRPAPDRTTRRALWAAGILFVLGLASSTTLAAKPVASCWWEGTTLHATNLPDEWSVTLTPNPTGEFPGPSTYEQDFGIAVTAYFWTRGGPYTAVFKPGRQLNDYKPVCVAVP